jgi:hypothetical protein
LNDLEVKQAQSQHKKSHGNAYHDTGNTVSIPIRVNVLQKAAQCLTVSFATEILYPFIQTLMDIFKNNQQKRSGDDGEHHLFEHDVDGEFMKLKTR